MMYKVIENGIEYDIIKDKNGSKYWFYKNKCHRKNKPAVEWANGAKFWYKNDKIHREDGPAIVWADKIKNEYWLNGIKYENFIEFNQALNEDIIKDIIE